MYHRGRTVKNENTGCGGETCRVGSSLFCARYSGKALVPSLFEERPEEHEGRTGEMSAKGASKQQE